MYVVCKYTNSFWENEECKNLHITFIDLIKIMSLEPKEEYIESEILCYFLEKWWKAFWKNDIKGFYDQKNQTFKKNKSNFIRNWISDIGVLWKGIFIAIEVKKPSEMSFFDRPIEELQQRFAQASFRIKNPKKYLHAVEQRKFLDDIISEGWIWFFACSVEQVIERLKNNWIII